MNDFSSINVFPKKILQNNKLLSSITEENIVYPHSIHLNITNRCNFSCKMCICSERDKMLELSFDRIKEFVDEFVAVGTKTIILTGGGEPLLHPDINKIIKYIYDKGIKLGLVTNGVYLCKLNNDTLNMFTWIRVSCTDDIENQVNFSKWLENLRLIIDKSDAVDWGFSHVVSYTPNVNVITKLIMFANLNNFTHIRLSKDKCLKSHDNFLEIKTYLKLNDIDDSLVIYEENNFKPGIKNCYVSLLKPVIGADGFLYPCCNISFANKIPDKAFIQSISAAIFIKELVKYQIMFDGSSCEKCYLYKYNELIDALMTYSIHKEFV